MSHFSLSIFQQIHEKKTKSLQNTTIANKWRSETNPNQSYTSGLACWCIVSIDGRTKQSKKLRWCWKLIRSRFPLCRMVIAESRHRQVSVFGCDCHNAFIYLKQFGIWVEHQKNSRRIKTLPKLVQNVVQLFCVSFCFAFSSFVYLLVHHSRANTFQTDAKPEKNSAHTSKVHLPRIISRCVSISATTPRIINDSCTIFVDSFES